MQSKKFLSFKNTNIIAEFEARSLVRNPSDLLRQLIYEPILYVLIFSNALSGLVAGYVYYKGLQVPYISFAYPGILGILLLRSFSQSIYRFAIDARWGMQSLKLLAGTGCLAYGVGTLSIPILTFLIQCNISFVVYKLIGGDIPIQSALKLQLFGTILVMFWHSAAILLGFIFKTYAKRDMFLNLIILPMTMTSPAFYTLDLAPKYIQYIAAMNPLAYQIEWLRQITFGKIDINNLFLIFSIGILLFIFSIWRVYKAELVSSQI